MSIKDDFSPAVSGQSIPQSDDEAAARVANCTAEHPETGLIGLRFANIDQLRNALIQGGWQVPNPFPEIMASVTAWTGMGIISRKGKFLRLIVHTYTDGQITVINSVDAIVENAVPQKTPEPKLPPLPPPAPGIKLPWKP